jgi:hypothetical protein
MQFSPKHANIRERIGLFGPPGAGKSNAIITWMRRCPHLHFHIIDNDDAYNFLIYEDDERNAKLIERENFTIHVMSAGDWKGHLEMTEKLVKDVDEGDVVVLDKISPLWAAAQNFYTQSIFGEDFNEYAITMRQGLEERRVAARNSNEREKRTEPIFDQFRDWGVINAQWKELMQHLLDVQQLGGAHLVCVADSRPVRDTDDNDIRKTYSQVGVVPEGQKGYTTFPHSVLHLVYDQRADEYLMTTVKDRGSRRANGLDEMAWGTSEEPGDFTKVYLGPVAGWKMQKVDA